MKPVETMAGHLHKVTYKEQLIICHVIRERSDKLKYAHLTPALLPFVAIEEVRLSLGAKKASRPIAIIIGKIGQIAHQYSDIMWLQDRKVAKVFGATPAKGRRFNWLPKKTINGNPIDPLVALTFAGSRSRKYGASSYNVVVHTAHREAVLAWVSDNLT